MLTALLAPVGGFGGGPHATGVRPMLALAPARRPRPVGLGMQNGVGSPAAEGDEEGLFTSAAEAAGRQQWDAISEVAARSSSGESLCEPLRWTLHRATWYLREESLVIQRAADVAAHAHRGQLRKSGDDFIIHPVETACILADLKMDLDTIVAGLLHDTVEDTDLTLEDIEQLFGSSVATIVRGDSKISKLCAEVGALPDAERRAVNQRNMLLAMSADWRIVVVKLADRLHNMRTLEHMPRHKQVCIARETVEIFVPLARRLGIVELERELLHRSIEYLFPQELKGVFGIELLGHMARMRLEGALDNLLRNDEVLFEGDVDSKLSGHRELWLQHTNAVRLASGGI